MDRGVALIPAPKNHLTAGPNGRVRFSATGRIRGAGGYPAIHAGIVSPTGVHIVAIISTPDDHFSTGPDGRV